MIIKIAKIFGEIFFSILLRDEENFTLKKQRCIVLNLGTNLTN